MRCEATRGLVGASLIVMLVFSSVMSSLIEAAPQVKPARAAKVVAKVVAKVAAKKRGKKEIAWHSLAKGLEIVRATYRPALVWYDGAEVGAIIENDFSDALSHSSLRSTLGRYVVIRISTKDLTETYSAPPSGPRIPEKATRRTSKKSKKADAKGKNAKVEPEKKPAGKPKGGIAKKAAKSESVGDRLRLPSGQPALLVLDFRERLVQRYDVELPKRSRLSSRLKKILKVNAYFAKQALPVEKALVESRKAFKVGNSRAAVLKVRELESPKIRKKLDPVLQGWSADVIKEYRDRAGKLLAEASGLEKEGDKLKADSALKYNKALEAYQKIARDFPFKDIAQKANQRQGEILRKMTLTGNPFGK